MVHSACATGKAQGCNGRLRESLGGWKDECGRELVVVGWWWWCLCVCLGGRTPEVLQVSLKRLQPVSLCHVTPSWSSTSRRSFQRWHV